jgi:hypothetical protein
MNQLSDSDGNGDSVIGVKRKNSDSDSDSDSAESTFSENDKYVRAPFVEPGKPILKKGVSNSVNPTIPPQPSLDKGYTMDASKDAKYSETHAKTGAPLEAKLSRQEQNSNYNIKARSTVVANDAKKRAEIIALFKKWEEDNPPPDARVRIDETLNTSGTAKRKTLEGTVTVEEDRRQKSKVVAAKVSVILFELLKDIPLDQVNTKIDELIANASPVNKSLKRSDELTARQVNHLKNADLFDEALNETIQKINNYKNSDTTVAEYTKNIIYRVKDKLSSWLFGTTTEGGYSRSKTIKRSKKQTKRERSSKKLTKRIRSLKRTKRRSSKKRKSSKDFV